VNEESIHHGALTEAVELTLILTSIPVQEEQRERERL